MNLKYVVNYEYETRYSCEESRCDDICRCMEIINPRVESVNISDLVDIFYDEIVPNDPVSVKRNKKIDHIFQIGDSELLDKYCIHRILTMWEVWENRLYTFEVVGGYYGDEVESVELLDYDNILASCREVYKLNTWKEKIEFVLELEYGEVIYKIENVKLIRIKGGELGDLNMNHFNKIKKLSYYNSENYLLPRGIVRKSGGGKYSIVDGYHRIKSSDLEEIIVWEIE
jgi:hypothetical protein